MSEIKNRKQQLRQRRIIRVRAKIHGTAERPRLAVYKSLKHISAQAIDDLTGKTVAAAADKDIKGAPLEKATIVGGLLAKKLIAKNIKQAVFDKRHYSYHGQVKALADGARAAGLNI
jgi:large subunit ribosomal protein L18